MGMVAASSHQSKAGETRVEGVVAAGVESIGWA